MKIDFERIKQLSFGAVDFEERNGALLLHRFTPKQREVFVPVERFLVRSFSDAGVRIEFTTDAARLVFSGEAEMASSLEFYYFDICVNGVLCHHLGSESSIKDKNFRFEVELPQGMNRIAIYFPMLSKIALGTFELPGASVVEPVQKSRSIVCYGDSITQGYNARYPSVAYPNAVADALDARMVNKAIGGALFTPELAAIPDDVRPDLITVAYGTNDWDQSTRADLIRNTSAFFDALEASCPGTPVRVLLPIWRKDRERTTAVGSFADTAKIIGDAAAGRSGFEVIDGLLLVPHLESCFTADGLHPNDFGFQFMSRALLRHLA